MKFTYKMNEIVVEFEDTDTATEKEIILDGLAVLKGLLRRIKEVEIGGK